MTDEELNKRLHEIMGIKWYTEYLEDTGYNYDFVHTWRGFGILLEFMKGHGKWGDFIKTQCSLISVFLSCHAYHVPAVLISPPTFAKAVGEFFEEEK